MIKQIKLKESKDGSVCMTFPKKIDGKPSQLKDLKILLGNTNDLDQYLLKRAMNGKFDIVRIVPKGSGAITDNTGNRPRFYMLGYRNWYPNCSNIVYSVSISQ
jgi:hypothetical protein